MKKFVFFPVLSLILAILASCANPLVSALAETDGPLVEDRAITGNVELYRAWSVTTGHYGITEINRGVDILVKNLAYAKKVWVRHQMKDGSWKDVPASYVKAAGSGVELWTVSMGYISLYQPTYDYGTKFCLKYEVNGSIYWDNNGGANYDLATHGGYLLGKGTAISNRWASQSQVYNQAGQVYFSGAADLKNLGYAKNVKVWYSSDNWASKKSIALSYNQYYHPSYGSPIPSPNAAGVEFWTWYAAIPSTGAISYYLSYTVGGKTYYDSNFGANYRVEFPPSYN